MSLESQIAELTKAVNTLTKTILEADIDRLQATAKPTEPVEAAPTKTAPNEPVSTEPSHTADDLKRLCMAKVKENRKFKETLKEFLKETYGVSKTSEVPDDKVDEAYTRIERGEL